ncbi:hypothetical protein PMZ80_007112 [Knufia obscura]|uniref:Uncharacterized protein n=1 Tax=Knufia obscura TaxID=1635080 RepID=A0ABR0RJD7_9EURO|nr:hypothetical protein PMZ80_007112 [Knufia obscura]
MRPFIATLILLVLVARPELWQVSHVSSNMLSDTTMTSNDTSDNISTSFSNLYQSPSASSARQRTRRPSMTAVEPSSGISYYQFECARTPQQYEQRVAVTVLDVRRILTIVVNTLQHQDPVNPTDASFLRYFFPRNLQTVQDVFGQLLMALGGPTSQSSFHVSANNNEAPQINIFYLDPANVIRVDIAIDEPDPWVTCSSRAATAYTWYEDDLDYPPQAHGIALCEHFFDRWLPLDRITADAFGKAMDSDYMSPGIRPSWPAARALLHGKSMPQHAAGINYPPQARRPSLTDPSIELLHYDTLYTNISHIGDLSLLDPVTDRAKIAYGAYYSMKLKIWPDIDGTLHDPVLNNDNYVLMALEIYYRETYGLSEWEDPKARYGATDLLTWQSIRALEEDVMGNVRVDMPLGR